MAFAEPQAKPYESVVTFGRSTINYYCISIYAMLLGFNICYAVGFQYMLCCWVSIYAMLLGFNICYAVGS